ncbi:MAG TPA: POTRA domain-containing protein [Bryobacteraceae bacterium]
MLEAVLWCALCGRTIVEVSGAPASLPLETRAGDRFDPAKLQRDVHTVWNSGRVSDVQVEALTEGDAVRLVFHIREKQSIRVHRVRVDPPTPGVRVTIEPGTELDAQGVQQIAAGVRKQLESSGFLEAKVEGRVVPVSPVSANLDIRIDKRRAVDVAGVTFSGDLGVKPAELRRAARATRTKTMLPGIPGLWHGWHVSPGYNSDAVQADLVNLRSLYYRRGYFDADVRLGSTEFSEGAARVDFIVHSGQAYRIRSLNGIPLPDSQNPVDAVCRDFFTQRSAAERRGVIDSSARLEIDGVNATTELTSGPAYHIERIDFRGNHKVRDATLRRLLLLDEGAPLDEQLLRQSLARLNRTGWFEPLTERSVVVNTPPGSDRAHVIIGLKEAKNRHWSFSGPAGPMSIGGSLDFAIGSRLPSWGRGLVELSTYTASLNLMLLAKPMGALIPFLPNHRFIQFVTIERPLLPGDRLLSGFAITPQYGWQGMVAGYGMSQTRNFLHGILGTDRVREPALAVTVSHEGREGVMSCEALRPRFDRIRQVATPAVNVLFSFSPI